MSVRVVSDPRTGQRKPTKFGEHLWPFGNVKSQLHTCVHSLSDFIICFRSGPNKVLSLVLILFFVQLYIFSEILYCRCWVLASWPRRQYQSWPSLPWKRKNYSWKIKRFFSKKNQTYLCAYCIRSVRKRIRNNSIRRKDSDDPTLSSSTTRIATRRVLKKKKCNILLHLLEAQSRIRKNKTIIGRRSTRLVGTYRRRVYTLVRNIKNDHPNESSDLRGAIFSWIFTPSPIEISL